MAFTRVQQVTEPTSFHVGLYSTRTETVNVLMPSAPATGNLILVMVGSVSFSEPLSRTYDFAVTDSAGNTYNQIFLQTGGMSGAGISLFACFSSLPAPGGSPAPPFTVSVTWSMWFGQIIGSGADFNGGIIVAEYSPAATSLVSSTATNFLSVVSFAPYSIADSHGVTTTAKIFYSAAFSSWGLADLIVGGTDFLIIGGMSTYIGATATVTPPSYGTFNLVTSVTSVDQTVYLFDLGPVMRTTQGLQLFVVT